MTASREEKFVISVIVPVYNAEKYLVQCLDSLVKQTYSDLEIITVNDCSTDGSLAILKRYADTDQRVKVIDLPVNHGVSYARNIGIKSATGEWISFVDSDDWVDLDRYEKLYHSAIVKKTDAALDGFKVINDKGVILYYKKQCGINSAPMVLNGPDALSAFFYGTISAYTVWIGIYRTSVISRAGLQFRDVRREDYVFNLEMLSLMKTVVLVPGCSYNYRDRESSLSRGILSADSVMGISGMDRCAAYLRKHPRLSTLVSDYREYIDNSIFWDCLAFARKSALIIEKSGFSEAAIFLGRLCESSAFRQAYENDSVRKKQGFRKRTFGWWMYHRQVLILLLYMTLKRFIYSLMGKRQDSV